MSLFVNRTDAAQQLAHALQKFSKSTNTIVLGLPRGGVPIASVVAQALNLPLDIIVTRKLGAPMQPELALGALTQSGVPLITNQLASHPSIAPHLDRLIAQETKELTRRLAQYKGDRAPLDLRGKTALIVDDGIATGATIQAAITSAKELGAGKIIVAAPVAPPDVIQQLKIYADQIICLTTPAPFGAIGQFYTSFPQVEDQEVIDLLKS